MGAVVFFAIVGILVLFVCGVADIISLVYDKKELKKRKAHPKFYGWIAELNEMVSAEVRFHNTEISPLVREIDKMIAEMPYLTAEKQVQMVGVLEEYKETLADRKYELKRMEFESAKLRNRIREYNKEHNLESGWND
jgi:hypothetical protein